MRRLLLSVLEAEVDSRAAVVADGILRENKGLIFSHDVNVFSSDV